MEQGNTVIVIEQHIDIIKQVDWIVDIGPDGGNKGGSIVFGGQPLELIQTESVTGKYLV